jgi:hypothetical protein
MQSGLIVVLVAVLLVIGTVRVLPQLGLPDSTIHENSSPVVVKSRTTSGPRLALAAASDYPLEVGLWKVESERPHWVPYLASGRIPILFCCLLR